MNVDLDRTGESVHQRVHTRGSQKESRQIKTYFNQVEILTKCKKMNNVNVRVILFISFY